MISVNMVRVGVMKTCDASILICNNVGMEIDQLAYDGTKQIKVKFVDSHKSALNLRF